jgi:hypothetical protein
MGFFTRSVEASFLTAASGERLYCRSGPWSRPYSIPDADTEQRIKWKLVWKTRVLVLVLPFLYPLLIHHATLLQYAGVVVLIGVMLWPADRALLAADLKHLGRAAKLPWKPYYRNRAEKLGYPVLVLCLIACLGFVAAGAPLLASGRATLEQFWAAILGIVVCGLLAIAFGFMLWLKSDNVRSPG